MFDALRRRVARWILGPSVRMYAGAKVSRLNFGFGVSTTSADSELKTSLAALRNRSRQLVRDAAYALRARTIVVNNVIGSGIGMQAQVMTTRGMLAVPVNNAIESQWCEWMRAENCHTGGAMHFADFERAAMCQVFDAGEVLIRRYPRPFGRSKIPLALELVEAERLADDYANVGPVAPGNQVRMGVEVDLFLRPVAYWIKRRHPGDVLLQPGALDYIERVPADQIYHLKRTTRWPQVRGEPWMHTAISKLNDMEEYTRAELVAARASANFFATVESTGAEDNPLAAAPQSTGERQMDIEPGLMYQLPPGEKLNFHAPNRPNSALDAFMKAMLREVASGLGVSYASLSADYSESNYSSSRLALLDDRDNWRVLQQWWIRSFREPLHREWLAAAVLSGAIKGVSLEAYAGDMRRYEAVLFKPRGWSWVDPTKEVAAYKEAVRAGFTTTADVIAATGGGQDIEDVIATRKRELEMFEEAEIELDTTVPAPGGAPIPARTAPPPAPDAEADDTEDTPPARVFAIGR